jgi:hypothetical protein
MEKRALIPIATALTLGIAGEIIRDSMHDMLGPPNEHLPHADHLPVVAAYYDAVSVSGYVSDAALGWPGMEPNEIKMPEQLPSATLKKLAGWPG